MWLFDRYLMLRQVIVNTKSDKAFRGVLWRKRWGYLVLKDVALLKAGGEILHVDGEVVLPAENVDFIQVL